MWSIPKWSFFVSQNIVFALSRDKNLMKNVKVGKQPLNIQSEVGVVNEISWLGSLTSCNVLPASLKINYIIHRLPPTSFHDFEILQAF